MSEDEEEDDTSTIPLQDLRPFYRSRARQDVTFVRASSSSDAPQRVTPSSRAADIYAAIVLKDKHLSEDTKSEGAVNTTDGTSPQAGTICEICQLPLDASSSSSAGPHAASLAHQVCLAHSHPPSHLDRAHVGLRYMTAQGWDPDARLGLGAEGTGIRAPIKAIKKNDTAGLGLVFPTTKKTKDPPVKRETLDAGKVRKQHAEGKRKDARLREMFYGDDKIARYLGDDHGG